MKRIFSLWFNVFEDNLEFITALRQAGCRQFRQTPKTGLLWAGGVGGGHWAGQRQIQPFD